MLLIAYKVLSPKVTNSDNHHIFIMYYFLLILNIETIISNYIYIEKFITKLVINHSRSESKLLPISLLSFHCKY
ncbi:hypothetical protein BW900_29815 [Bacillus mycoides]|uniref:Uncharacterized protein n=1 Tax=Bacillus mycoides TaxID=1405 RepID=A0A1S9SZ22_BACMY|nr:hypothetical protein BW900_29815 [Bacillus mycoides]